MLLIKLKIISKQNKEKRKTWKYVQKSFEKEKITEKTNQSNESNSKGVLI